MEEWIEGRRRLSCNEYTDLVPKERLDAMMEIGESTFKPGSVERLRWDYWKARVPLGGHPDETWVNEFQKWMMEILSHMENDDTIKKCGSGRPQPQIKKKEIFVFSMEL